MFSKMPCTFLHISEETSAEATLSFRGLSIGSIYVLLSSFICLSLIYVFKLLAIELNDEIRLQPKA